MGRRRRQNNKSFATILPAREIAIGDLTPRQIAVLNLLADGKTNKEIADTLSIEPGTVKSHLSKLMSKYGLHTRTKLALLWADTGRNMVGRGQGSVSRDQDSETRKQIG